jgi:hypothetical protein
MGSDGSLETAPVGSVDVPAEHTGADLFLIQGLECLGRKQGVGVVGVGDGPTGTVGQQEVVANVGEHVAVQYQAPEQGQDDGGGYRPEDTHGRNQSGSGRQQLDGGNPRDQRHHHEIGAGHHIQAVVIDQKNPCGPQYQAATGRRPPSLESPIPHPGGDQRDQGEAGTDAEGEEQPPGHGGRQLVQMFCDPCIGDGQVAGPHHRFSSLQEIQIGQVDMGGGDDLSTQQTDEKHCRGI